MAVNLSPVFGVAGQLFDNNGNPLAGGKIFTYLAGTTTPTPTYTSSNGTIAHSNPIILDGAGRVPSGEIWLTDGITYKFVVQDSANNLIGTYDNLTGINSNFVNFTAQQEIQTATAGQTVFTLTTMQYQPGTNSLTVFVDGVNQYGPGAQYAFVESNSTTVTFVSGLHVGASVKFTTAQLNSTAATDACQVSYTPPYTGSVATSVCDKLEQTASLLDFGADPTGVLSSVTALQNAINSGYTINIPPGTYLIDADVELKSNTRLIGQPGAVIYRNSDIRIKGTTPNLTLITAVADFLYGSTLVTLDSTSYGNVSVGDYLWFKDKTSANVNYILDFVAASSAQLNDSSDWIYQVQCAKIVEKLGGNAVRINAAAHVDFPFTTTGRLYLVDGNVVENVVIDGLTFRNGAGLSGSSAEAAFINFQYVYNITIQNCKFELKGYTGGIYAQFGQTNINNNEFDTPVQLAVFLRQAMPNSVISGNVFRNQMTGDASIFVEAHNYNIAISDNTFDGARLYELADAAQLIACIQIEAKANNITVSNNSGNGYGVGVRFDLGAMFNTVSNNSFSNMGIAGIRSSSSGYLTITNNTFYNCGITVSPGTLTGAVGSITLLAADNCMVDGNIIGADSGYQSASFVITGQYNVISNNIIKNALTYQITNWNNRFVGNDGDSFWKANDTIGPNVVTSYRDVALADNVATTIATITTPNPSGSLDSGAFTVNMNLMAMFYNGTMPSAGAVASKSQVVTFAAATISSGTSAASAVSTIATSAVAQPGGFTDLTDPVVTVNRPDNYTYQIQVTSNGSGVLSAGRMVASIEVLWFGYQSPPVIS
jgi:hypothetical protein